MKHNLIIKLILFATLFYGCSEKQSIVGLWIVKNVEIGNENMTPNARWTRFNEDFSQQTGNGWFQHSIGTWKLNKNTNELSITNTNGLIDQNKPFIVSFENDKMIWKRVEEGQNVTITLEKTDELPETYGDKLLGLWGLDKSTGKGIFFDESIERNEYLFLRWDKRFLINSTNGRINGVYNIHGHKPEIEFIPYGDNIKRSFWKVKFDKEQISLTLLNSDSLVMKSFVRIHKFPND
jgi:hypothetical protein